MAATVEQIQRLKQDLERLSREIGEIEGRSKQLVNRLAELGYKTLNEALKALPGEKAKLERLKKERDAAIQSFYKQYGERIEATAGQAPR